MIPAFNPLPHVVLREALDAVALRVRWYDTRLGLNVSTDDRGVTCTPPKHFGGDEPRAAGVEIHEEQ